MFGRSVFEAIEVKGSLPAILTASFFRPACHFTAGSIKSVTMFKASDLANSLWEFNVFLKLPICLDKVKNIFSLSSGSISSLQRTSLKMDTIRSEKEITNLLSEILPDFCRAPTPTMYF